jgi:hypothetical protein
MQTVNKANTTTTLTGSPNPSNNGQTVTFTATISPAGTGTVQFFKGGTPIGTVNVSSGKATLQISDGAAQEVSEATGPAARAPALPLARRLRYPLANGSLCRRTADETTHVSVVGPSRRSTSGMRPTTRIAGDFVTASSPTTTT